MNHLSNSPDIERPWIILFHGKIGSPLFSTRVTSWFYGTRAKAIETLKELNAPGQDGYLVAAEHWIESKDKK